MYVFGVIVARGGSKGLPGKNIKLLGGLPLIAWSIQASKSSKLLSHTIVSTEDSQIAQIAKQHGGLVPFLRPKELARDDSDLTDVVQHAVQWLEDEKKIKPDVIVLLQATSPLRDPIDIDDTIQLLIVTGADSAQTITEDRHHPLYRYYLDSEKRLSPLLKDIPHTTRRQDAPAIYFPTGSVYVVTYKVLMEENSLRGKDQRGLVRSFETSIDIDDIWDLRLAELILQHRKKS